MAGGLLRITTDGRVERLDGLRPSRQEHFCGAAFRGFCQKHPCIGARSVAVNGNLYFSVHPDMSTVGTAWTVLNDVAAYLAIADRIDDHVKTLALIFLEPITTAEEFAHKFWDFAQLVHDIDMLAGNYDPSVSADPSSSSFEFSMAGRAIFTTTLNPGHPRLARHAFMPIWVCNQTQQFERLRTLGQFETWKRNIRDADANLDPSGKPNPVLADHGYASAADQLAGYALKPCPFLPRITSEARQKAYSNLVQRAKLEGASDNVMTDLAQRAARLAG